MKAFPRVLKVLFRKIRGNFLWAFNWIRGKCVGFFAGNLVENLMEKVGNLLVFFKRKFEKSKKNSKNTFLKAPKSSSKKHQPVRHPHPNPIKKWIQKKTRPFNLILKNEWYLYDCFSSFLLMFRFLFHFICRELNFNLVTLNRLDLLRWLKNSCNGRRWLENGGFFGKKGQFIVSLTVGRNWYKQGQGCPKSTKKVIWNFKNIKWNPNKVHLKFNLFSIF